MPRRPKQEQNDDTVCGRMNCNRNGMAVDSSTVKGKYNGQKKTTVVYGFDAKTAKAGCKVLTEYASYEMYRHEQLCTLQNNTQYDFEGAGSAKIGRTTKLKRKGTPVQENRGEGKQEHNKNTASYGLAGETAKAARISPTRLAL